MRGLYNEAPAIILVSRRRDEEMKKLILGTSYDGKLIDRITVLSDHIDTIVLAASTAQTVTIPIGAKFCLFSADGDFWVQWLDGVAAVIPAANKLHLSPELNPTAKDISGLIKFSVIAPSPTALCLVWYG